MCIDIKCNDNYSFKILNPGKNGEIAGNLDKRFE